MKSTKNLNRLKNTILKYWNLEELKDGLPNIIVIYGGPMTGKTTLYNKLRKEFKSSEVVAFWDTDTMLKEDVSKMTSDINIVFTNRSLSKIGELFGINSENCNILDIILLPEITKKEFLLRSAERLSNDQDTWIMFELDIKKYFEDFRKYKSWVKGPRKSYSDAYIVNESLDDFGHAFTSFLKHLIYTLKSQVKK